MNDRTKSHLRKVVDLGVPYFRHLLVPNRMDKLNKPNQVLTRLTGQIRKALIVPRELINCFSSRRRNSRLADAQICAQGRIF